MLGVSSLGNRSYARTLNSLVELAIDHGKN
jgi:hypothetical protein